MTEKVELVINLEPWVDGKQYDRLGMDSQTTSILDIADSEPDHSGKARAVTSPLSSRLQR